VQYIVIGQSLKCSSLIIPLYNFSRLVCEFVESLGLVYGWRYWPFTENSESGKPLGYLLACQTRVAGPALPVPAINRLLNSELYHPAVRTFVSLKAKSGAFFLAPFYPLDNFNRLREPIKTIHARMTGFLDF